ncbi:hypothetical protein MVES1_002566 [Malassezia vespertilionis]|uniref:uncharacterized protein n=1 Tax=Malassezia vespertilionis TaxID=2020962 RepID=UPI0024B23740|nr:uncharacterized protein MVES1_002566 [Malassezia vespertilionis]WFD07207.1 hypothetical protein MVES1_002566 [Malassezia vespertilionis]
MCRSSFVLQLMNCVSVPYITGLYFLRFLIPNSTGDVISDEIRFGTWGLCYGDSTLNNGWHCSSADLGYRQKEFGNLTRSVGGSAGGLGLHEPFLHNLPYALVLQAISAGFTGIAAGAGLLAICSHTLLFTLAAFWAAILTIATLVIELILFINAHEKLTDSAPPEWQGRLRADYGPALWMQVAATAAVIVGFLLLFLSWILNRPEKHASHAVAPLPTSNMYQKQHEPYGYDAPANRYDNYGAAQYQEPVVPGPPPVTTASAGRAYEQPYVSNAGAAARPNLVYDPAAAGSKPGKRISRQPEDPQRRRHSHRRSQHDALDDSAKEAHRKSRDIDQAYLHGNTGTLSRHASGDIRRRSYDPYLQSAGQYEMDIPSRSVSRLHPALDYYADQYQSSGDLRWKRYSDRGVW